MAVPGHTGLSYSQEEWLRLNGHGAWSRMMETERQVQQQVETANVTENRPKKPKNPNAPKKKKEGNPVQQQVNKSINQIVEQSVTSSVKTYIAEYSQQLTQTILERIRKEKRCGGCGGHVDPNMTPSEFIDSLGMPVQSRAELERLEARVKSSREVRAVIIKTIRARSGVPLRKYVERAFDCIAEIDVLLTLKLRTGKKGKRPGRKSKIRPPTPPPPDPAHPEKPGTRYQAFRILFPEISRAIEIGWSPDPVAQVMAKSSIENFLTRIRSFTAESKIKKMHYNKAYRAKVEGRSLAPETLEDTTETEEPKHQYNNPGNHFMADGNKQAQKMEPMQDNNAVMHNNPNNMYGVNVSVTERNRLMYTL